MKFILLLLIVFRLFAVYSQSEKINCSIGNPNKFLQKVTPSMVNKPTNLKLNLKNGTHPIECNSYRVRYNKNGKLKDSVLHENTIWNLDGTLSSRTWYDAKGVVSLIDSYTYEKKESDSIITAHKGSYGNFKYYFNEKNILYKFESSYDSTFSSIKVRHLYTYDEAANFVEASINAPSSSSPDQIWKWEYDPINFVAKVFVDDRPYSIINLRLDSCLVENISIIGGNPTKTIYYFDANENILKEINYRKFKNKIKSYVKYYEWNGDGKLTREYGRDFNGDKIDIKYTYDQNGLLITKELQGKTIKYNYVFQN